MNVRACIVHMCVWKNNIPWPDETWPEVKQLKPGKPSEAMSEADSVEAVGGEQPSFSGLVIQQYLTKKH
jgi:hypothetical protein